MQTFIINKQLPNGKGLITLPDGKKLVTPVPCAIGTLIGMELDEMEELYLEGTFSASVGPEYRTPGYYTAPMMSLSDGADLSDAIDIS